MYNIYIYLIMKGAFPFFMDDLSDLLIDKKTEEKFRRVFKVVLKRNRLSVIKQNNDYYTVSNGTDSLDFDVSAAKYEFARSKAPEVCEKLCERMNYEFHILTRLVSFTNGQEFLRYTIMRSEELSDSMIYEDFIGNLKKVMCFTADNVKARLLDIGYMKKWDVPKEVLFSVADRNMCRLLGRTEFSESLLSEGGKIKCLDMKAEGNDFTAALIMCADFKEFVSARLSPRFLVAAPSKDTVIVMSEVTNDVLERLGTAIVGEYRWASRPLTTDIFLYTSYSTEIAGHFAETLTE